MHHRGRCVGKDRVVQVCEQAGIAPDGWRQDSEIVHVAKGTLPTLHHRPARAARPGQLRRFARCQRIGSFLRWVGSMKAPKEPQDA